MIKNHNFLTPQGLQELKEELKVLKEKKLPAAIKRVARARSFGDLTENTEYAAAREALSLVEIRIGELEEIISRARIIKKSGRPSLKGKRVELGGKVTVSTNGEEHVFTVVGEWEADPFAKKISVSSPLGKALIGKKVNSKIEIEAPAGKVVYTIKKIE